MNEYLLQCVLGGGGGAENIVDILIVVIFIAAWAIRTFFLSQKQGRPQQKRPVSNRPTQRTPVSGQRAQAQKDRVEQFLESILQPKRMPQPQRKHPASPVAQESQHVMVSPDPKTVVPLPGPVLTNEAKPAMTANPPKMAQLEKRLNSEEELGISIMEIPGIDTKLEKLEKLPEVKEEYIQENQHKLIYHKEPSKASQKKSPGILPTFSDTDDLKRAILYAEILGKPLSMRQSQSLY